MVEYDDLAELQASELPSLKIADSTKFSQGLIPAIPKVNNGKKNKELYYISQLLHSLRLVYLKLFRYQNVLFFTFIATKS